MDINKVVSGGVSGGSRNIQSVRTARDPHAATSHISRTTSPGSTSHTESNPISTT